MFRGTAALVDGIGWDGQLGKLTGESMAGSDAWDHDGV
jgi:hypothetical protein